MKKIVTLLTIIIIIFSFNIKAQVSFDYNFGDSTWTNVGVYTNKTLYIQKDSGGGDPLNNFYFKFVEPNVQFSFLPSSHNDGTPSSIFWLDNNGWVKKSPISSLVIPASRTTGFSAVAISGLFSDLGGIGNVILSTGSYSDPSWLSLSKSKIGLSNVENTALSTWAGTSNISLFGIITSGVFKGTPILDSYISSATTWNSKQNFIASGTTSQYLRGDGTLATFPTIPSNTNQLTNGSNYITLSSLTGTSGISYNSSTGVITNSSPNQIVSIGAGTNISVIGSYPNYTVNNTYSPSSPSITSGVSRSLNTSYTISTTQNVRVFYTIRISYSITVLLGSTGSVSLPYSINGGSSWITVSTISNNLNLGIALTGYNDFNLIGEIPANALIRLNSTNATNTYQTGEEVIY